MRPSVSHGYRRHILQRHQGRGNSGLPLAGVKAPDPLKIQSWMELPRVRFVSTTKGGKSERITFSYDGSDTTHAESWLCTERRL